MYEFIEYGRALTWSEAEADAAVRGGYLATLVTQPEDSWVYTERGAACPSLDPGRVRPVVGRLPVAGLGGACRRVDLGEWRGAFTYTNWNNLEPNNTGGDEGVMHMFMPVVTAHGTTFPTPRSMASTATCWRRMLLFLSRAASFWLCSAL